MWQLGECLLLYSKQQPRPAAGACFATQANMRRVLQKDGRAAAVVAVLYGKEFQRIRCTSGTRSRRHHPAGPERCLFFQWCFVQFMEKWSSWQDGRDGQREAFVEVHALGLGSVRLEADAPS